MIKTELLNDGTLIKHFSDAGYMLLQVETNIIYSEPIDTTPCQYTYKETDILIGFEEDENFSNLNETEQKAYAYDILMGVSE